MKDCKILFSAALAHSETMIVERILIRILPVLLEHQLTLTAQEIKTAPSIWVPDAVYAHIERVTQELTGIPLNAQRD